MPLGIQAPGEKPWPWLQEYAAADKVVAQVLERCINSPLSSSCGRLFDAVSAMLGLCERISYEGQAAIRLEAIQDKEEKGVYSCPVIEYDGIVELDTLELFAQVHAEWRDGERPATISRRFHLGLIDGLCRLCLHLAERCSCTTVALSGGVMQNLTLATELPRALAAQGASVLTHRELPPNDACISLGQAAYGQLVLQTLTGVHPVEILARMKTILSILWKVLSTTRVVVANIFFLVVVFILLGVFFTDTEDALRQNSVLLVNPAGTLVEQRSAPEAAEALLKKMGRETARADETKTQDVIDAIRKAATDPKILALVIAPRDLQGCDTTKILDIGKAILDFKETGKPVLAHSMVYTQGQYLLSSYADTISVNPLGGVLITGFGMYQTYFKGLLDKTRINFHVFRVGDYKTAVEPFVRESMSEEAREAGREWLSGLWQAYLDEASKNRGVSPSDIVSYVENIDTRLAATGGDAARLAVNAQLVDEIKTSTQFDQLLAGKTGKRIEDLHRVGFQD